MKRTVIIVYGIVGFLVLILVLLWLTGNQGVTQIEDDFSRDMEHMACAQDSDCIGLKPPSTGIVSCVPKEFAEEFQSSNIDESIACKCVAMNFPPGSPWDKVCQEA